MTPEIEAWSPVIIRCKKMVDLLDRFESEEVSRGLAATGRASAQGRGGAAQDRAPVNPFDEIEIGSLSTVSGT